MAAVAERPDTEEKKTTKGNGEKKAAAAEPVVKDLGAAVDDDDTGIMEVPCSLCMACGESGLTRMILTKIPFFREVIVSSFECDSCGWTNNEVQFGGSIQEQGCRYELKVTEAEDLNRQVIKSDNGAIFIPELELEIPAKTQRGSVNTIEGVLQATIDGLQAEQDFRRAHAPEVAAQVDEYLARLALYKTGSTLPFTFIVDDPAGNSFVENPAAPRPDPKLLVSHYERTPRQDLEVGLQPSEAAREAGRVDDTVGKAPAPKAFEGIERLMAAGKGKEEKEDGDGATNGAAGGGLGRSEAIVFQQPCPNCHKPGEVVNCVTDIPYFKEVLIMAFTCGECGYRNNEIKGGGAIPAEGTLVTLKVEEREDFTRDVLKSDTAGVHIPELDLEITQGSLGGFFTSVEGLLEKIREHLKEGNPFGTGDSAVKHHLGEHEGAAASEGEGKKEEDEEEGGSLQKRFREFMAQLDEVVEGQRFPFTVELRDPLGNSFIGFRGLSPEEDARLRTEPYQRSWDEDEHLGLHDMATEGYETGYDKAHYASHLEPELKRHPHTHGGDHPTPFARGCEVADSTPGAFEGRAMAAAATAGAATAGEGAAAVVVEAFDVEAEEEADAGFEAAEAFGGAKAGRVFKLGKKGLGYYTDKRQS